VDLILGQGMPAAGWHAQALNAPGKFLVSAPEHDTPRRARAYLVTDEAVAAAAARHAGLRPALDQVSRQAIAGRAQMSPGEPAHGPSAGHKDGSDSAPGDDPDAPETILWIALSLAPAEGITVPELMDQTGMSRPWVYQRLQELVRRGQATLVSRGRVEEIIEECKDVAADLRDADPADTAAAYRKLGVRVTYHPDRQLVRAAACTKPANIGKWSVSEERVIPGPPSPLPRSQR
jgi:hypothetical protein